MKHTKRFIAFLTVFLVFTLFPLTGQAQYYLPSNIWIPANVKFHFGDDWIQSTVPIKISIWYEDNWMNYTVASGGVQYVHNGSIPEAVYFDGVEQEEDDTWSYSGGTVTVSPSGTDVALYYGEAEPTVTGEGTWQVYIPVNGSLAFQNQPNIIVTLSVSEGILNSTSNTLQLQENTGLFRFTAINDTKFAVNYTEGLSVKVSGNQGKGTMLLNPNDSVAVDTADTVTIQWNIHFEPLYPLMFLLGMVGIAAMSGGPIYAVVKIREKEYRVGLRNGVIWTAIGVGLVIGWLW